MDETGIHVPISIDGGVNTVTGKKLVEAGADILIAGSSVFGSDSITDAVKSLKAFIEDTKGGFTLTSLLCYTTIRVKQPVFGSWRTPTAT